MTSFEADDIPREWSTFKVQGQVYHRVGSLLPEPTIKEKFLQIYFIEDYQKQLQRRLEIVPVTRLNIVETIQNYLDNNNLLLKSFKKAVHNGMRQYPDNFDIVICSDIVPKGQHIGCYNAPAIDEVAAVITGQKHGDRDIVINHRGGGLKYIKDTHKAYDALQYPLIYTKGEVGYDWGIQILDEDENPIMDRQQTKIKTVTAMDYHAYMLMIRDDEPNHLHKSRGLFLQFLVDMYVKIETERLSYIKTHQKELRVEEYQHLKDAIENDKDGNEIGKLSIMPSSITGSDRYFQEKTQDGLTYAIHHGPPDLFMTVTCNPKWDEITRELLPGQEAKHRPDLVARVFKRKLQKVMDILIKHAVFGPKNCFMYTVEWQKRGLPHVHILLWLKNKIRPSQIDSFISAEIPDPVQDPELYKLVTSNMIHGPCGPLNPGRNCMKEGKCTKKFPRDFLKETKTGHDGYPLYRRRNQEDGGRVANVNRKPPNSERQEDQEPIVIDNRWVVPYCPLLLRALNCHVNVELCSSIKAIKYICKYINKGNDMATFALKNRITDEIQYYLAARYISSGLAVWRILHFDIHSHSPAIIHLDVHLEGGERVPFDPKKAAEKAQNPPRTTTLTGFFDLCKRDPNARKLRYCEVPKYYTWNKDNKHKCIKGPKESLNTLSWVYSVHPIYDEC